jgi:hypothetical protein
LQEVIGLCFQIREGHRMRKGSDAVAVGIGVGVALGVAIGNIGAGIAIGLAVGAGIAASKRTKKTDARRSSIEDDDGPPGK